MKRLFAGIGRTTANVLAWIRDGIARRIIRARIPPNALTLAGPVAMAFVFWPILEGRLALTGWMALLAVTFDSLDGAVARRSGRVSRFGAYLDSFVDRYADMLLLFAVLAWVLKAFDPAAQPLWVGLWCAGAVGTLGTSYARARAEVMIPKCAVGFFERPERTVTVIIGLWAGNPHIAILIMAIWTNLIAVQRVAFTHRILHQGDAAAATASRFAYWIYPRGPPRPAPPAHAAQCIALIAFLVFGHHLIPRPF